MTKVIKKIVVAFLVVSFFVFPVMGTTGGVQAQDSFPPELEPQLSEDGLTLYNAVTPLVIVADPDPEMQGIKAAGFTADDALAAQATAMSTFSITYVAAGGTDPWGEVCQAFPAAAMTAFEAAANIWATRLQSSVPITIQACWADLGSSSILGYSGGAPLHRDFAGAPKANTWYDGSLANSLAGYDLDTSSFDDYITYNSGFTWYYGTDGNTPSGQYDLVSVAAHEIGHGLNFSGSASYSSGSGSLGLSGYPIVYDTFMEDGSGTALTSYTSPSTALGSVFTSNNLWFDGPNANAANGGTRVKMYAPSTWSGGSSYSHLDYTTFASTPNALMVYAIGSGTARHDPGPVTMGLLQDLGWSTSSGTVPTPQSPVGTITNRTPTYTWTEVEGATSYQYELVQGTTTVYTPTVDASACVSGTCSDTPATTLAYASYKWRVRAMVDGSWGAYSVYKTFTIKNPYISTPKAPTGTITDRTPTYKWTKVDKATQYQIQLKKGTTTVYTKTVGAGACVTTTCSNTPATTLAYASYKWRVRALVGGTWRPYSVYKSFTIVAPTTGFDSQFTSNAAGWTPMNGKWSVSGGSYHTPGLSGIIASTAYKSNYSKLTYQVRMKRTGCTGCVNSIYFRGNPSPISSNPSRNWDDGYRFSYTNSGYYQLLYTVNGVYYSLIDFTYTSSIVQNGWNTLKVTANGTYMEFYINGRMVAYGNLTRYSSGKVGIGFYRSTSGTDHLYADWAKLSMSAPSSVVPADALEIIDLGQVLDLDQLENLNLAP